jgi:shikimate kinase
MTELIPTNSPPVLAVPSLFLIGPMGSGKTAVGRVLARLRRQRFIDADAEVERRAGVDIPFIFEQEGEAGFREREQAVIDDLTQWPGVVLATGGGAVTRPVNCERLRSRGIVIYLEASVAQQLERTQRSRHRPLLRDTDPAKRLAELMAVRETLYQSIAHLVISTDRRKVAAVAEAILQSLDGLPSTEA